MSQCPKCGSVVRPGFKFCTKCGNPMTDNQNKEQLNKAKDLIRNIIRVTWKEGWNYSLDWKVKAEEFLKESKND